MHDYQVRYISTDHFLVKRFESLTRPLYDSSNLAYGLPDNMAVTIVISTGDFQIRCNVLSLSFSERESGKWPLRLSDFSLFDYIMIISVIDCVQHSGQISICTPN